MMPVMTEKVGGSKEECHYAHQQRGHLWSCSSPALSAQKRTAHLEQGTQSSHCAEDTAPGEERGCPSPRSGTSAGWDPTHQLNENSTQVYYIEVHIEAEASKNFTDLIDNLIVDVNRSATVEKFSITTECNRLITGKVNCRCNSDYSWSEDVCQNYSQCCNQNECTFSIPNPRAMCLSRRKVLVKGSFTLADLPFTSSLDEFGSQDYNAFVEKYTRQLQQVYSTLNWFDSLKITRLRQGSIIADFVMTVTDSFKSTDLENTTNQLQKNTNGSFNLIVTGLVKITRIPQFQDPIPYNSKTSITCSMAEALGRPQWFFQKNAQLSQDITNGTEAIVTYDLKNSTVTIKNTTEVWKGTFTCDYRSNQSNSIIYRGSQYLDIALLPEVLIISDPQFPSCTGTNKQFYITVKCIIPDTTENYTVKWTGKKIIQDNPVSLENGQISYQAYEGIFCDEKLEGDDVSCQFQNRLNQTKIFSLYVPIINDDSTICKSDLDWPDAKANFNATKLCNPTAVGLQMRYCMANGTWGDLISFCVNQAISKLLNVATNLQKGLGIVEKQANGVFVQLKQSTDDKSFETFANVNASVGVLESMRDASDIQKSKWNDTVFPDIVKSLSNLLNGSLNDSWRPVGNEGSYTLALKYLRAVDGIINQTNFVSATNQFRKENVQGFFILLTGCFGEKKVRDALQKRFRRQQSMNYKSESSSRITSTTKTK
ncbi:hypothetical protein AOLI_G00121830 [Acnodon oligacanthus]